MNAEKRREEKKERRQRKRRALPSAFLCGQGYRLWLGEVPGTRFAGSPTRQGLDGHHGTVKLRWEMLPAGGGEVISVGFDFLVLGEDGRIHTGYQFIEA